MDGWQPARDGHTLRVRKVDAFLTRVDTALDPIAVLEGLSDEERRRAMAYRDGRRWRSYVGTRLAVRQLAAWLLDRPPHEVELHNDPYGRPVLPGADLELAVARHGERLLLTVARGVRLAVSLQPVPDRIGEIHLYPLTWRERRHLAQLAECHRATALARTWTRKDAALRLAAPGTPAEANRVQTLVEGSSGPVVVPEPTGSDSVVVTVYDLPGVDGLAAAVATAGPVEQVCAWTRGA